METLTDEQLDMVSGGAVSFTASVAAVEIRAGIPGVASAVVENGTLLNYFVTGNGNVAFSNGKLTVTVPGVTISVVT